MKMRALHALPSPSVRGWRVAPDEGLDSSENVEALTPAPLPEGEGMYREAST